MISSTNTVGTMPKDSSSTPFLYCVFLSRSFPDVCLTLLCNIQSFHFVNKTFEKICISWKAPPEDISGGAF